MRLVITLTRADSVATPYTAPAVRQPYLIDVTTCADRWRRSPTFTATLDWSAMDSDLASLRTSPRAPALERAIGARLLGLLHSPTWNQCEQRIHAALSAGHPVHITVVSNAVEVYRLPWELLPWADRGARLQARERLVIGYAWPAPATASVPDRAPSARPTRIVFAWSAAGGNVPQSGHRDALVQACAGDIALDVVDSVTLARLRQALQAIGSDESVALHVLCHGIEHDGHGAGYSLAWDGRDGAITPVSAAALGDTLEPYVGKLATVTLCACHGAGADTMGRHLGPVALEVHRLGIPWVIGARYPLSRTGSLTVAEIFYSQLCRPDGSVEQAFARARQALDDDTERRDHIGLQLHARDEHRGRHSAGGMASGMTSLPGKQWRVPGLPPYHLDRPDEKQRVIAALCERGDRPVSIGAVAHGLHGMGGIGKTVLATAVARSRAIAERYVDGVYWLTVGQEPQLTTLQSQFARALGIADTAFDSPIDGKQKLMAALAGKRALLVLDDVWDAAHADVLEVVGEVGRILITTRNLDVLTWRGAEPLALDIMSTAQARALLATWTGVSAESLPAEASDVAEACGRLPLALAIAGSLVRRPGGSWARVLRLLQSAKLDKLRGQMPAYPYRNVYQAIAASVTQLVAEGAEQCYAELAVFAEDEDIPASALRVLWGRHGRDADDVDDLAGALASYSLAGMSESGSLRLHDIQRGYVRACHGDTAALHGAFIDAYAETCQGGDLARGPAAASADADACDYFYARLPYHLIQAGRPGDLRRLLGRYPWLDGKLRTRGAAELIADYQLLADLDSQNRGLLLIRDSLRLSSHVLANDPSQLPGQLIGRLMLLSDEFGAVASLLAEARVEPTEPWICPLVANLTPPGGPLLRTFAGHSDWVSAVALSADMQRALSGSLDSTLKLWNIETGALLHTFQDHSSPVYSVALSLDGQRALSGSSDQTLKLWDTESGALLHTFQGHTGPVRAVALSLDGQRVLSGSSDQTLKLWDTESGRLLQTFQGHSSWVRAVAMSLDGRRALSGSHDRTLKLWDTESGDLLHTFTSHSDSVRAVALNTDGQRALSGSHDGTLKLWDTESGDLLRTFSCYLGPINTVALSADEQQILSGFLIGMLQLWDTESGDLLHTFPDHSGEVRAAALSLDGQRALSGSEDKTLRLWNTKTGESVAAFSAEAPISGCSMSTSTPPIIVAGDETGRMHFLQLITPSRPDRT